MDAQTSSSKAAAAVPPSTRARYCDYPQQFDEMLWLRAYSIEICSPCPRLHLVNRTTDENISSVVPRMLLEPTRHKTPPAVPMRESATMKMRPNNVVIRYLARLEAMDRPQVKLRKVNNFPGHHIDLKSIVDVPPHISNQTSNPTVFLKSFDDIEFASRLNN